MIRWHLALAKVDLNAREFHQSLFGYGTNPVITTCLTNVSMHLLLRKKHTLSRGSKPVSLRNNGYINF